MGLGGEYQIRSSSRTCTHLNTVRNRTPPPPPPAVMTLRSRASGVTCGRRTLVQTPEWERMMMIPGTSKCSIWTNTLPPNTPPAPSSRPLPPLFFLEFRRQLRLLAANQRRSGFELAAAEQIFFFCFLCCLCVSCELAPGRVQFQLSVKVSHNFLFASLPLLQT